MVSKAYYKPSPPIFMYNPILVALQYS